MDTITTAERIVHAAYRRTVRRDRAMRILVWVVAPLATWVVVIASATAVVHLIGA